MKRIVELGIILMIFCVISAAALSLVYLLTKPTIELYSQRAFEKSLREVIPTANSFKEINKQGMVFYQGMVNGIATGAAFSVAPQGYSGKIELMVGVALNGKVAGIKILNQHETPGLGANVIKPVFLKQFIQKSLQDPIEPKKDIDAITGATITTRAVSRGVKSALDAYQTVRDKK